MGLELPIPQSELRDVLSYSFVWITLICGLLDAIRWGKGYDR